MLNLKKGLAVALAAATALTFAPVSASAGTLTKQTTASTTTNNTTTTTVRKQTVNMNSTSNVWSYDDTITGTGTAGTAWGLANENTAVVVLTPSETSGSVTFTQNITSGTTYADGKWFDAAGNATANNATGQLKLTAAKDSKTLNIATDMSVLRGLTAPKAITVAQQGTAGATTTVATDLTPSVSVTVVLSPHAVQMNSLKVILSTASDTAYDRYANHGSDKYVLEEARPKSGQATAVANNDLVVEQKVLENTFKSGDTIYNVPDSGADSRDTADQQILNLADSTKDKAFKVESNADVTYKSSDDSIATIDKDGIHAKKVGETVVTITTKQSLTAYGELTVKIPVKVINKPAATLAGPDDLYIHGFDKANAVKIGVTGSNIVKNSITYKFVYWDAASQSWVDFGKQANGTTSQLNPYVMDRTSDSVYVESYTGNDQSHYNWGAYLEADATAADGYTGPAPKYIRLHFDNSYPFELDAAQQKLHVGESVQITTKVTRATTGAAFAYKSWNPAVATVSSTGAITAVGEGSTKIDVTYAGRTQSVTVTVKEYENGKNSDGTPVQVTGVTVSNKKGAAVKVTFDKSSIKNVKYYVQKKVSGKTSGKSVGSNKTTLSVKKGATVKVRVKAYYYDAAGNKLVGSYSAWKSLKTDKK